MSFQSRAIGLCLAHSRHLHPWGDNLHGSLSPLDPADRLSFLGHYSRALPRIRTAREEEKLFRQNSLISRNSLALSAFIWTKKACWQVKNADFRQIFRSPEYMAGDLLTELGATNTARKRW